MAAGCDRAATWRRLCCRMKNMCSTSHSSPITPVYLAPLLYSVSVQPSLCLPLPPALIRPCCLLQDPLTALPDWAVEIPPGASRWSLAGQFAVQGRAAQRGKNVAGRTQQAGAQVSSTPHAHCKSKRNLCSRKQVRQCQLWQATEELHVPGLPYLQLIGLLHGTEQPTCLVGASC